MNSHFPIYKYQTSQASSSPLPCPQLPRVSQAMPGGFVVLALFQIVDLDRVGDCTVPLWFWGGFLGFFPSKPMHNYPRLTGTVLGIGSFPVVPCSYGKRDEHLFGQMTITLHFFFVLFSFFLAPSFLQSVGSSLDGKHWGIGSPTNVPHVLMSITRAHCRLADLPTFLFTVPMSLLYQALGFMLYVVHTVPWVKSDSRLPIGTKLGKVPEAS